MAVIWWSVWIVLAVTLPAVGTVYHVNQTNASASDDNAGTVAAPWRTVTKAVSSAAAGDTVFIWPGIYYEAVTNLASGSSGSPITFSGFRGGSGEWLTTIDASVSFASGWVASSNGIYRRDDMPFEVRELTVDGYKVWRVWTNGVLPQATGIYTNISTGLQLMSLESDARFKTTWSTAMITWWDGVDALFCSVSNTTWLRFRDGSSPNGRNIRGGQSAPRSTGQTHPAVRISDVSYITWSNVSVRGASLPVRIDYLANHITLVSNRLSGGDARVYIGYECKDNYVIGNDLTADLFGTRGTTNLGAWLTEGDATAYTARLQNYLISKFVTGSLANTMDDGVYIYNSSSNNVVGWNTIHDQAGECVYLGGQTARPVSHTLIFSNNCSRSSDVGIILMEGQTATRVFRNYIEDCDIALRYHHMDTSSEVDRTVFVYRNNIREPYGVGNGIYTHFNNETADTYRPTYWTYHNTFTGGQAGLQVSSYVVGSGGLINCRFLNNIFNGTPYVLGTSFGGDNYEFWTNPDMVGAFDFNIVTPPQVTYPSSDPPAWVGVSNVFQSAVVWPVDATNFTPPAGSVAVDSALRVNTNFVLRSVSYPALPDDQTVYGLGMDIGSTERKSTITVGTVTIGVLVSGRP